MMKRTILTAVFFLVLTMLLTASTFAWSEYGVIYDETELLQSDELTQLGTEVLPALTQRYGIDMRVDILKSISGYDDDLQLAAEGIYEEYGYGYGDGGNGVTLTLLVSEDDGDVSLIGFQPYAGGDSWELTTNGSWNLCRNADTWLTEEAWAGDLAQDIEMLEGAIRDMADGLESFVLAGGVISTIWDPQTQSLIDTTAQATENFTTAATQQTTTQATQGSPDAVSSINHITDMSGLLTDSEWERLERQARALSADGSVAIYVIAVDDYTDYADGFIEDAADALYEAYDLGFGNDGDGILLLMSMLERDYSLISRGSNGRYVFNDAGLSALAGFFLDDFSDDAWFEGLSDYLKWCENYLTTAQNGTPYSQFNPPMDTSGRTGAIALRIAVILLLPLAVAGITIGILGAKMYSVAAATKAAAYQKGSLELTEHEDHYTHTTHSRTRVSESRSGSRNAGASGKF